MTSQTVSAWMARLARRKAAAMTREQRAEHARKMALARWSKAKAEQIRGGKLWSKLTKGEK